MPWLRKHPKSGRPQVRWTDLSTGRERSRTFSTLAEAERFKLMLEGEKARGDYFDPSRGNLLYGHWVDVWWSTVRGRLSPQRARDQDAILRNHILPRWGRVPLGAIDAMAVAQWVIELQGADSLRTRAAGRRLSASSIRRILFLFQKSLKAAVAAKYLRESPVNYDLVELPKIERMKVERFLTQEEAERILNGHTPEGRPHIPSRWRMFFEVAVWTGARWGEVAGLRKADVDIPRARPLSANMK